MASTQLEKLMFTIGLVDKISKPVASINNQIGELVSTAKSGFSDMAVGAAGLVGTGMAIQQMLGPAIEMDRALGEVKSLGVNQEALGKLSSAAIDFSSKYGKSASEFVSASYDIQSAIGGLTGDELSSFTNASGVLAAATKADTSTITSYMGTMYGIFSQSADEMGKAQWVEQVSGMTASAVQMFKTNGMEMAGAFGALGASATSMGVDMAEQMAIMGTLQATMSGSEAATKYKSFLAGAGKAQEALGLSFTDSQGNMLGVLDILEQIQGKYGDSLTLAQSDELAKAFGSQEAVAMVKMLMNQTDGLSESISKLGATKGMESAEQMADAMVDPWERLSAGIEAVQISIGSALLPVINPLITRLADGARGVMEWTQEFPNLTKVIGLTVVGIVALGGAMAAVTLITGICKTAWAGMMLTMKLIRGVTLAWTAAQWLLNAALAFAASPIFLIVLGVAALAAVMYAAWLGVNALWDAFKDSTAGRALGKIIDWVIDKINMIPGINIGTSGDVDTTAPKIGSLDAGRTADIPPGGVTKQISNAVSSNNSKQVHIGKIETSQKLDSHNIEEMLLMAGG